MRPCNAPQPIVRRHRRGAVLHLVLGAAAFGAVAVLGTISATRTLHELDSSATSNLATSPIYFDDDPTPEQIERELMRTGLDPETLACAGCTAAETQAVVGRARSHLLTGYFALETAQVEFEQALFDYQKLVRTVQQGVGTQAQRSVDLPAARASLATKKAARDGLRDQLYATATEGLDLAKLAAIELINDQREWSFDGYFKVAMRSEADSVALRDALAHIRINTETGREVDPEAQRLVSGELAKPAIASAKVARDSRIDAVQSAWDTALGI